MTHTYEIKNNETAVVLLFDLLLVVGKTKKGEN